MAKPPKEGNFIYHITPIENLESIIVHGLKPRKSVAEFRDIANPEILQKREEYELEEFTPFHFFSGTPFCGSVQINNKDTEFIYLALKREVAKDMGCLIVPRHPINYDGIPLDWDTGFDTIDWQTMAIRDYDNHECKEICSAEAIYKGPVKIELFRCIFVKDESTKTNVQALLRKHGKYNVFVNISNMFVSHD